MPYVYVADKSEYNIYQIDTWGQQAISHALLSEGKFFIVLTKKSSPMLSHQNGAPKLLQVVSVDKKTRSIMAIHGDEADTY